MNTTIAIIQAIKEIYLEKTPLYVKENSFQKSSESILVELENKINEKIPMDFKLFLLNNDLPFALESNFQIISIQTITRKWEMMAELLEEGIFDGKVEKHKAEGFVNWENDYIQRVWWNKKWLPFAEDSCGNLRCIDFFNGENGKKYQIIQMEIQGNRGPYFLDTYEDFKDVLEKTLESLKTENYELTEYRNEEKMIEFF